jgi:hypothetical protein
VVDTPQAEQAQCSIALLHHPWAYLAEFDATEVESTLHHRCDLVLRGHLHHPQAERLVSPDPQRSCLELAVGAAYAGSRYPNAYLGSKGSEARNALSI